MELWIYFRDTSETQAGCRKTAVSVLELTLRPLFFPSLNSEDSRVVLITSSGARVSASPSRLAFVGYLGSI